MSQECFVLVDSRLLPRQLASLQERQDSLVVEGGIIPVHPMSCLRHHHVRLTYEAAFEFGRDEEEHRRASLSRHQERRELQLPQIPTVEGREGGYLGQVQSERWRLLFHQLRSYGLWEIVERARPGEQSQTFLAIAALQRFPRIDDPSEQRLPRGFSHGRAREEREDGRLAENEAADEFGMVHCQRERDVRAVGVPNEMCWSGLQFLDQRSKVGHMSAQSTDILSPRWSVGRVITPAVGDDTEASCERLRLCSKNVQIPKGAVNEHDRFTLAALEVVERCLIDLDRADIGTARCRLTSCVREARAEREQRKQDQRET